MRLTDTIYPLAFITYNHSCVTSQPMQTAVKDQCDPLTETLIFTTPRGERFGGRGDGCKATETRAWKHLWEPIWVSIILTNVQWVMHTTELCLLDRIIHKAATAKTIYNLHMQTIRFGPQTMPGFSKSGIFSFLFSDKWSTRQISGCETFSNEIDAKVYQPGESPSLSWHRLYLFVTEWSKSFPATDAEEEREEKEGVGGWGVRARRSADPGIRLLHPSDVECGTSFLCLLTGFPVSTESAQAKGQTYCKALFPVHGCRAIPFFTSAFLMNASLRSRPYW